MVTSAVLTPFTYAQVPVDVASKARDLASRLRTFERQTTENAILFGQELIAMKGQLGHGHFTGWLRAEFPHGIRTAQNFMSAAEAFGEKRNAVSHLPVATVYRLAAPSTPESLRTDIVRRIDDGEKVTPNGVDALIRDARRDAGRSRARRMRAQDRQRRKDPAFLERQRQRDEREERASDRRRAKIEADVGAAVEIIMGALNEEQLAAIRGHLAGHAAWYIGSALSAALLGTES